VKPRGVLVVLCILRAALPETGIAQEGGSKGQLAPPSRGIVCQRAPSPQSGPGDVVLSMAEEPPDSLTEGRSFTARYDSAGGPLSLLVLVHEPLPNGHDRYHGIAVEFGSVTTGFRTSAEDTPKADHSQQVQVGKIPLTEMELDQSRTLAFWLWNHRCGRTPRGVPQNET
jgi:hypothetical protein